MFFNVKNNFFKNKKNNTAESSLYVSGNYSSSCTNPTTLPTSANYCDNHTTFGKVNTISLFVTGPSEIYFSVWIPGWFNSPNLNGTVLIYPLADCI